MFLKKYWNTSIKAIVYSALFIVLLLTVMLLYANNWISDKESFFVIVMILVAFSSLYSVVKGNVDRPLLYNIVAVIFFVVFSLLVMVVLAEIYVGWVTMMFYWTEIFSLTTYLIVILIDSLVCVISMKKTNKY